MLPVLAPVLALVTHAAAGPIAVQSDVACPTSNDLAVALAPFVPAAMPSGYAVHVSSETATRDSAAAAFRLELVDPTGDLIYTRSWPAAAKCGSATEELAVLAATWLADLLPQSAPPLALVSPTVAASRDAPPGSIQKPLSPTEMKTFVGAPKWIASLGGGVSSPGDLWAMGALSLSTRLQLEALSPFYVGLALFGTLPRTRTLSVQSTGQQPPPAFYWYRVRLAAETGVQVRQGRWGGLVGGGLGGGVLVEREKQVYQYDRPDAFAYVQARLSYAWDAQFLSALWLALSFNDAFLYRAADQSSVGATPNSRYEGALLAGADFSILD